MHKNSGNNMCLNERFIQGFQIVFGLSTNRFPNLYYLTFLSFFWENILYEIQ